MSKELCRSGRPPYVNIDNERSIERRIVSGHNREKRWFITFSSLSLSPSPTFNRKVKLTLFLFYYSRRRPSSHVAGRPFDNSSFSTSIRSRTTLHIHKVNVYSAEDELCMQMFIRNERKSACNGQEEEEEEGQLDLTHRDRRHCTYASASYYSDLNIYKK